MVSLRRLKLYKHMEVVVKKSKKLTESHNVALTERQIKRRVGEAWALLESPVYERGILVSAKLLYFNTDKSKVWEEYQKSKKVHYHYALRFYGTMDPNTIYTLSL